MANPPPIDRALLEHLADLARLQLPPDATALRQRLERIVSAFSALQDLAAHGPPAPPAAALPLRPDEPEAPLPAATVLANAPRQAAGAFVVPRVVDA